MQHTALEQSVLRARTHRAFNADVTFSCGSSTVPRFASRFYPEISLNDGLLRDIRLVAPIVKSEKLLQNLNTLEFLSTLPGSVDGRLMDLYIDLEPCSPEKLLHFLPAISLCHHELKDLLDTVRLSTDEALSANRIRNFLMLALNNGGDDMYRLVEELFDLNS